MLTFHNKHAGETCLIIGNGPGLSDIPLSFLEQYLSFGTNLINRLDGFTATYYTAVDSCIMFEFQDEVIERYADVPKFLPTPNLDKWQGEKIYRFLHNPGPLWPHPEAGVLWPRDFLSKRGITYISITHVALQLAFFMGFETMLCVGLDNTGDAAHFYADGRMPGDPEKWDEGYLILFDGFRKAAVPRKIINISTRTAVTSLPRDDLRNYDKSKS